VAQFFESVIRIKPSASRKESAEIYFLCLKYGQTKDVDQRKIQNTVRRFSELDHESNPTESNKLGQEIKELLEGDIKSVVESYNEYGMDVPDDIKE